MSNNQNYILGWDTGGWLASKNCFSLISINPLQIILPPTPIYIPQQSLLKPENIHPTLKDSKNIIIAIDAPLGVPASLRNFFSNPAYFINKPTSHIDNPLAFRATDRYIYEKYRKMPLPAMFGTLGYNTTLALSHLRFWNSRFPLDRLPSNSGADCKALEIYPGILTVRKDLTLVYLELTSQLCPELCDTIEGIYLKKKPKADFPLQDHADALICAFLGAGMLPDSGLPPLDLNIPEEYFADACSEGWIYVPS